MGNVGVQLLEYGTKKGLKVGSCRFLDSVSRLVYCLYPVGYEKQKGHLHAVVKCHYRSSVSTPGLKINHK